MLLSTACRDRSHGAPRPGSSEECGTGQAQAGALPLAAVLESSQTAWWLEGAQLSMAQRLFSQEYRAVSPPQAAHKAALPAKCPPGVFPGVQWLRLHASNVGGVGSILGQGTRIPHAGQHCQKVNFFFKRQQQTGPTGSSARTSRGYTSKGSAWKRPCMHPPSQHWLWGKKQPKNVMTRARALQKEHHLVTSEVSPQLQREGGR